MEVGKTRVKGEKEIWIIDKVKQKKLVEGGQFETGKKCKNRKDDRQSIRNNVGGSDRLVHSTE